MIPKLGSDAQRRVYLALSDDWQAAQDIAEIAGIPVKGAGTALLALTRRGLVERRDGCRAYEYRRFIPSREIERA